MESRDGKLRQQRRNVPRNKNKPSQDYVSNCTPSKFNICATFEQAGNASGNQGGQIVQHRLATAHTSEPVPTPVFWAGQATVRARLALRQAEIERLASSAPSRKKKLRPSG
jgi:hypothetical protein